MFAHQKENAKNNDGDGLKIDAPAHQLIRPGGTIFVGFNHSNNAHQKGNQGGSHGCDQ